MTIQENNPLYFKKSGDTRWHFNNDLCAKLWKSIPEYNEDVCPVCGNTEKNYGGGLMGEFRKCYKCQSEWHWHLNKTKATMVKTLDKIQEHYNNSNELEQRLDK
jgi:hypothetical protein